MMGQHSHDGGEYRACSVHLCLQAKIVVQAWEGLLWNSLPHIRSFPLTGEGKNGGKKNEIIFLPVIDGW